jgi:dolichol kinase
MGKELRRQFFHLGIGLISLIVLIFLGRNWLMAAAFFSIIIGLFLVNRVLLGYRIGIIELFLEKFERDDAKFPGWGSATYAGGITILVTVLENAPEIAAGITILALGDSASTIIGRRGCHRIPYNPRKTVEGSLAFFLGSLPAYLFIGPAIVPLAFITAFIESIDLEFDDNLTIPIATIIAMMLLGV